MLSNDKRAIRYCLDNGITALDLPAILNLLWTQRIVAKEQIRDFIQQMSTQERLTLSDAQLQRVFVPRTRRR